MTKKHLRRSPHDITEVGVGLTWKDAKKELKEWQQNNPADKFRLKQMDNEPEEMKYIEKCL